MDDEIQSLSNFYISCEIHQNTPLNALMHPWGNSQTLDENSLRSRWTLFGKNISHYFRLLFQMT